MENSELPKLPIEGFEENHENEEIHDHDPQIVEDLPSREKAIEIWGASFFHGPLPPPQILGEYEKLVPGAADRIISMAERQASHRQDLEKVVITGDSQRADRGLNYAFVITMVFAFLAALLFWKEQYGWGIGLLGADLLALVGIFISKSRARQDELQEKGKQLESPDEDPK